MIFNSLRFLVFFPAVLLVVFLLPERWRQHWLLVSSYFFYMCWNPRYVLLILFATTVSYLAGLLLEKLRDEKLREEKLSGRSPRTPMLRKLVLGAALFLNLGLLALFKYSPALVVAVGISFYTFQSLGYVIDVYRGTVSAERNFFRFALFISFFPQLVAGPIERSGKLMKELEKPVRFLFENARDGLYLMLWGYFLKVVIADRLALFVDTVYGEPERFGGWYLLLATALFHVQAYCDFCGYSTIAMGAAEILGIRLTDNFNSPLLSGSVKEFWSRWHVTLGTWFRDYLYIPLGGSRAGKLKKYRNLMLVFLASGLWHGGDPTFLLWGGVNGLFVVAEDALAPLRERAARALHLPRAALWYRVLRVLWAYFLVILPLFFFRAENLGHARRAFASLRHSWNPGILVDGSLLNCGLDRAEFLLAMACISLLLAADYLKRRKVVIREILQRQAFWVRPLILVCAVCGILVFGKWGPAIETASFIYFQF